MSKRVTKETEAELGQRATDQYRDRLISGSIFCGKCGYCLRTLPYVYTCPECGNEYNARPLSQDGVFKPYEALFPFGDLLALIVCLPVAAVLLGWGIRAWLLVVVVFGVLYTGLAILFAVRFWQRIGMFIRAKSIARRIRMEEGSA